MPDTVADLSNAPRTNSVLNERPDIPDTHFVDHRVYNDPAIFKVETETIFSKVWKFVCHVSEVANPFDFRTTSVAGVPLLILRNGQDELKCFVNICSHRGARFEQRPAGNARRFMCPFHHWTFNTAGECVGIPRSEAYDNCGLDRSKLGLREVRIETVHGLAFVNLDDDAISLEEYIGSAMDALVPVFANQELEVISYSEQVLETNWKNWQETNMDLYHEYLHVVNRRTSLTQEGYHDRQWSVHQNGHTTIEPMAVNYANMPGWEQRSSIVFDGLKEGEFRHVCLFPDIVLLCRSTILRIDVQIPISPTKTLVQYRGLAVKGEPAKDRLRRTRDHNEFWGPFGRNLPEDMVVAVAQTEAMSEQTGGYTLFAREDGGTTMDDMAARGWYAEWSRRTGLNAADPVL